MTISVDGVPKRLPLVSRDTETRVLMKILPGEILGGREWTPSEIPEFVAETAAPVNSPKEHR